MLPTKDDLILIRPMINARSRWASTTSVECFAALRRYDSEPIIPDCLIRFTSLRVISNSRGALILLVAVTALRALGCNASSLTMTATSPRFQACLPKEIKPTDVVSTKIVQTKNGSVVEKVTVEQKLIELNAYCENGKLVDGAGNEIYFYKLTGCWGNPPRNYQEILERQRAELEKLRKQYAVIEMTCNPSGLPEP